jgi:hypothetical protein
MTGRREYTISPQDNHFPMIPYKISTLVYLRGRRGRCSFCSAKRADPRPLELIGGDLKWDSRNPYETAIREVKEGGFSIAVKDLTFSQSGGKSTKNPATG